MPDCWLFLGKAVGFYFIFGKQASSYASSSSPSAQFSSPGRKPAGETGETGRRGDGETGRRGDGAKPCAFGNSEPPLVGEKEGRYRTFHPLRSRSSRGTLSGFSGASPQSALFVQVVLKKKHNAFKFIERMRESLSFPQIIMNCAMVGDGGWW